jgi:hypothetical protein
LLEGDVEVPLPSKLQPPSQCLFCLPLFATLPKQNANERYIEQTKQQLAFADFTKWINQVDTHF